jgi:hypothetical protein
VAVSVVYCTMTLSVRTQKAELSDFSNSKASDRPSMGIGKGREGKGREGKGREGVVWGRSEEGPRVSGSRRIR